MPVPQFITHTATPVWNTNTTPKTVTVRGQAGDVLLASQGCADFATVGGTPTNDGVGLVWTPRQINATSSNVWQAIWTATLDTTRAITVTFTTSGGTTNFGADVSVWRGAVVGASAKVTGGSGAPTLAITPSQAASAIVVLAGDWAAVAGGPTWRTEAGALTPWVELDGDAATYAARLGVHLNAGPRAAYNVGLTLPAGETYSLIACEVVGTETPTYAARPAAVTRRTPKTQLAGD